MCHFDPHQQIDQDNRKHISQSDVKRLTCTKKFDCIICNFGWSNWQKMDLNKLFIFYSNLIDGHIAIA